LSAKFVVSKTKSPLCGHQIFRQDEHPSLMAYSYTVELHDVSLLVPNYQALTVVRGTEFKRLF
jgi:hypothetical protein